MEVSVKFGYEYGSYDEGDADRELVLNIKLPGVFALFFSPSNGTKFTAQEYQDFADGHRNKLEFEDVNGNCIIARKTSGIEFLCNHRQHISCTTIPERACKEIFSHIVRERSKLKDPEFLQSTDHLDDEVELFEDNRGIFWMRFGIAQFKSLGFRKDHIKDIRSIIAGHAVEFEVHPTLIQASGRVKADGEYVIIGESPKGAIFKLPPRFRQKNCIPFFEAVLKTLE